MLFIENASLTDLRVLCSVNIFIPASSIYFSSIFLACFPKMDIDLRDYHPVCKPVPLSTLEPTGRVS
jgi:hypothetical protein